MVPSIPSIPIFPGSPPGICLAYDIPSLESCNAALIGFCFRITIDVSFYMC